MKRAKSGGELVSSFVDGNDLKDEINMRTARAGYTTREGNPVYRQKISTGWSKQYEDNFMKIKR